MEVPTAAHTWSGNGPERALLCQPLGSSLVVHSLVLVESISGLLPLQPGIRVLGTVAVRVGESAQAAYKAQRGTLIRIRTCGRQGKRCLTGNQESK